MATEFYHPYPGGISEHVCHLSKELQNLGHEVTILTSRPSLRYYNFEDPPNVVRVGLSFPVLINKSLGSMTLSPLITRRIKKILEKNFDIVHVHGGITPTIPLLTLYYSNSVNFATFHSQHEYSIAYELFKPVLTRVFNKIHGLIAVSQAAKESIAQHFGGEYRIIPNGVDTKRFTPHGEVFEKFHDGKTKNILFVGRLEPRKGLKYLLKAMPYILEKVKNARLIVVGTGPLEAYYKSFVKPELQDKIIFLGPLPPEDIPKIYRTCHVFVSPATGRESFGIVLIEALASGIPVCASKIKGYEEVITDGVNGLLFEPKDPLSLAKKVIEILSNKELSSKLVEQGLKVVKEKYSWEKVAKEVEDYYFEILGKMKNAGEFDY